MGASHVQHGFQCIAAIGLVFLVQCQQSPPPASKKNSVSIQYVCGQHENDTTLVMHSLNSSRIRTTVTLLCQNGLINLPVEPDGNAMYMYFPRGFYFDVDASSCIFRGPFDVPGNVSVESYHVLVSYSHGDQEVADSVECFLPKRHKNDVSARRKKRAYIVLPPATEAVPSTESTAAFTTPGETTTIAASQTTTGSSGTSTTTWGSPTFAPAPAPPSDETPACAMDKNPNYIMEVAPHCGSDTDDSDVPFIDIITDLPLAAIAKCHGGYTYEFVTSNDVSLHLAISYDASEASSVCVFKKSNNSAVYNVRVELAIKKVHSCKKDFQVSCTFDMFANGKSASSSTSVTLIAAKEIQSNQGNESQSTVEVRVVDVFARPILGPIQLKRKVQLEAEASGTASERGLKPVSCDAVGVALGRRYAVLRAGCGDGLIFAQSEGFTTDGLKSVSPFFKAFKLAGDSQLRFECNFTLCSSRCDGSSCTNSRLERSVDNATFTMAVTVDTPVGRDSHNDSFVIVLFAIASTTLILSHVAVLYKGMRTRK